MDMDALHPIKPCPFCGSEAVTLVGSSVRCGNCGASGPFGGTVEDALGRWNARHDVRDLDPAISAPLTIAGVTTEEA